jgi:hypothetical protein
MSKLINELTDWHNLLQGGLGSLVGSFVGVVGAYVLAVRTIHRQQRADRDLAREQLGLEAAGGVARALVAVEDATRTARIRQEIHGHVDHSELDELLRGPTESFQQIKADADPLLPELVAGRLRAIYMLASSIYVLAEFSTSDETKERISALDDRISRMQSTLRNYRRDPLGTVAKLQHEERKRRRRQRWERLRNRLRRRTADAGDDGAPRPDEPA